MPGGGDLRRDKWLIGTTLVLHRTSNPAMPLSGSEQALAAAPRRASLLGISHSSTGATNTKLIVYLSLSRAGTLAHDSPSAGLPSLSALIQTARALMAVDGLLALFRRGFELSGSTSTRAQDRTPPSSISRGATRRTSSHSPDGRRASSTTRSTCSLATRYKPT